jgi:hypothetical protein
VHVRASSFLAELDACFSSHHTLLGGLELAEPGRGVFLAARAEAHALVLFLGASVEAVQHVLEVARLEVRDEVAVGSNCQRERNRIDNKYCQQRVLPQIARVHRRTAGAAGSRRKSSRCTRHSG